MPRRSTPPRSCTGLLKPLRKPEQITADRAQGAACDELRRRDRSRQDLQAFVELIFDDYITGAWLIDLFEDLRWFIREVEARRSPRLMVFAPPRGGKSHVISRAFPAWILGRHPDWEVISAAGTDDLAQDFGIFVRNALNSPIFKDLFPAAAIDTSSNATDKVLMQSGGGYRALGVGANIVGRGAHVMIIDDPITSRAAAYSAAKRRDLEGWYRANAVTRMAPGGGLLLMHQRWHPKDLAGTLLEEAETQTQHARKWRVLKVKALEHGESFFPERWSTEELLQKQAEMFPNDFSAMFQQEPFSSDGGFFNQEWFQFYSKIPDKVTWGIGLDLASSKSSKANRTAIMPFAETDSGDFYLAPDYVLDHLSSLESADKLIDLALKYNVQFIASEKGTLHNVLMPIIRERVASRRCRHFTFREVSRPDGKHVMAAPWQAALQARKVWFPNNSLTTRILIPQHLSFVEDADNGDDDGIDGATNYFLSLKGRRRRPDQPPPQKEAPTEDEIWEKIMARGPAPSSPVPFPRLNGLTYGSR